MDKVLRKYNALGDGRKKGKTLWQKIEFGNGKVKDLAVIRVQLTSHTAAISMSLKLYILGSLGEVESKLNEQGGELKGIRETIDRIAVEMTSSRSLEGEGSVWTAYEDDDKTFWRDLRRFDANAIAKKKALIKGYVVELGERGVFDDDEDVNDDSGSSIGMEDDKLERIPEEDTEDEAAHIQEIGLKKNFSDETEEILPLEEEDLQKKERNLEYTQGTVENKTDMYDDYANGRLNNDLEGSAGEDGAESLPLPESPPGHIFLRGKRPRSLHRHRVPPGPPSAHRGPLRLRLLDLLHQLIGAGIRLPKIGQVALRCVRRLGLHRDFQ